MNVPAPTPEAARLLRELVRRDAARWTAVTLASAFVAAGTALFAALSGRLVGRLAEAGPSVGTGVVVALALVGVARGAAGWARAVVLARIEEEAVRHVRVALHERLLEADLVAVRATSPAELGARLAYEADGLRPLLAFGFAGVVHNAAMVIALFAVLVRVDAFLAATALVFLPSVVLVASRLGARSRGAARDAAEARAAVAAAAAEHAAILPTVRSRGAEDALRARYDAVLDASTRTATEAARRAARVGPAVQALGAVLGALLVGVALARRDSGAEAIGTALAAVALLYGPAKSLSTTAHGFVAGLAHLDRLVGLLALPAHRAIRGSAPAPAVRTLEARGVAFAYGPSEVLSGVDLTLRSGELVALVGANGAGKSTLLLVLAGLLRPSAGRVFVGGVDVALLDPEALPSLVAWVPSEAALLRDTLLANVALGDRAPSEERARAALVAAGAGDWLDALPLGLATRLDPGLSTGERQRVALARALYADASILLLDEPTAGLDRGSADALVHTVEGLARERAVLVTSHLDALVGRADRVLRLDGGALRDASDEPSRARARRA